MKVRKAVLQDFDELYRIGKATPELKTSETADFMTPDEFRMAMQNTRGIFLVAEDKGKIVGFSYSTIEGPLMGCMVYTAIIPAYRGKGISSQFTKKSHGWLKKHGAKTVYALATNENSVSILKHWGYKQGKKMTWMDMDL